MPVFVSVSDVGLGRRHLLQAGDCIGRAPECALQLVASDVSKQHARLIATDDGFAIEDLESRNGVFVNGVRVNGKAALTVNCGVSFGEHPFLFEPDVSILPSDGDGAVVVASEAQTVQARVSAVPVAREAVFDEELQSVLADEGGDVVGRLVEALGRRIGFDEAAVVTRANGTLLVRGTKALGVSGSLLERCMKERCGLVCGDHRTTTGVPGVQRSVQSLVLVPLVLQGEVLGAAIWARHGADVYNAKAVDLVMPHAPMLALGLAWQQRLRTLERRAAVRGEPKDELLGASVAMQTLRERLARAAPSRATVVIHGETGTGKELVARALHRSGPTASGAFVAVNCAAIPETLVESELFGHERGAFSGAERQTIGKLELASDGTLFLDEVGELSLATQAKLLRALEERTFYRVGGVKPVVASFRLVAASHRDLSAMVADGRFREDLFYRLNVVTLETPSLRERATDVLPLAQRFLNELTRDVVLSAEAEEALTAYDWPGNVRELRNVIERAVVLSDGAVITRDDLNLRVREKPGLAKEKAALEKTRIREALEAAGGKKIDAAKALGISRPTLDKKIAEYGL